MTDRPRTTPGLRVPLEPADDAAGGGDPGGYVLRFGTRGRRRELLTTAQLMSLVKDGARELGLVLDAPRRG
jgi:hypothetical protein